MEARTAKTQPAVMLIVLEIDRPGYLYVRTAGPDDDGTLFCPDNYF